jgi:hypothetical protein
MIMRRPAALLASLALAAGVVTAAGPAAAQAPPTTGFEDSTGANWTTHDEELAFLEAIASSSARVEIDVIAETEGGRPMHLVRIGDPVPHTLEAAQDMPVELHICSQHGNEPAGREACLKTIRDLAFTDDATLIEQMQQQVTIYVPAANPDGRAAGQRENSLGVDLNRNHLEVQQIETRAIGRVVRDYKPVMNMDHHEYGPIIPALYDDDVLYLWARNLNVHRPLRDLSKSFAVDHLEPCLEGQAYRADEYGQYSVGEGQEVGETPVPDLDLQQSAGDEDDGISRNAAGLRHSMGILVESFVPDLVNVDGPTAIVFRNRRVDAQVAVIGCTMEWMRGFGQVGFDVTRESMAAKALEGAERSAPVFFNGQDEDTTVTGSGTAESTSFADPPPCGYLVSSSDVFEEFEEAVDVHDLTTMAAPGGDVFVTMAQIAEPVVGLLLDARGKRHLIQGEPLDDCAAFSAAPTPEPAPIPTPAPTPTPAPLPVTGGGAILFGLMALAGAANLRRS